LLLSHGHRVTGPWWRAKLWQRLNNGMLPGWLVELVTRQQALGVAVNDQRQTLTKQLAAAAPAARAKGLGRLTRQLLEREVCDWTRFQNRRQVSSDLGLCPREDSSGGQRRQGAITKHGNPRLRAWPDDGGAVGIGMFSGLSAAVSNAAQCADESISG